MPSPTIMVVRASTYFIDERISIIEKKVPTPRDDRIMPADSTGWPDTCCRNGDTSAMVENSTTAITPMKMQAEAKLRSLNRSKRTNGSGVVSEWARK